MVYWPKKKLFCKNPRCLARLEMIFHENENSIVLDLNAFAFFLFFDLLEIWMNGMS